MSTPALGAVSFTIRRPTPDSRATSTGPDSDEPQFKLPALPRHLTNENTPGSSAPGSPLAAGSPKRSASDDVDSSDEEDQPTDELVTGFDRFGVQRAAPRPAPKGPLVIPALKNRDWRELARRRRAGARGQIYVPPGGQVGTGADGSVGGLGIRDVINSGPQVEGLQVRKRARIEVDEEAAVVHDAPTPEDPPEETEDQRAMRALLADAEGGDGPDGPTIDIIPMASDGSGRRAPTEDDAFKQDVDELPDVSTLDDYDRVPVSQFGAALLRGMGWKPGEPASRDKKRGIVEPWLPPSRPALLGIGAKEREVFDDGSGGKRGPSRPERKYIPVVRKESDRGSRSEPSSHSSSRRPSRSPPRKERRDRDGVDDRDRRREKDRDRDYGRDRDTGRDRERDRDGGRRRDDRDPGSDRDRDRRRDRESSPRSGRRDRDRRDY
ncbi:DExH-box splicing factor binding site-domain-containing protein [Gloeopeniophorella convolvens]|nr:DExH-box splicing factor binding site-domain-containing protein [Gloeopeniophorella convolvens]